jgi:chemotaxis family two-component system response regulator Rcp1
MRLLVLEMPQGTDMEVLPKFQRDWTQECIHMEILLVDDNPADVRMVREGLKEALPDARLSVAADGVEAIRFLRREGHHSRAPRPDLIILDLRLPKKSGFDVLVEIKQDPALANIPVVVQSSSEAPIDIQRAYSLHANCYITKPAGFDEFSRTMQVLAEFWVTVAKLPSGANKWNTN